MSLAQVVEVTFGNEEAGTPKRTHHLLFNSWAMRKLEEHTGYSVGRLGLMLQSGRAGIAEQLAMVYAGLEGFRWRHKPAHHPEPFTYEEACVLIDDTMTMKTFRDERYHPVNAAIEKAWRSAFPEENRVAKEAGTRPDPPEASTTSQTGTTSSTQPS